MNTKHHLTRSLLIVQDRGVGGGVAVYVPYAFETILEKYRHRLDILSPPLAPFILCVIVLYMHMLSVW